MRKKDLLSGNFICKTWTIFGRGFFYYLSKSKTVQRSNNSSDDNLENRELPEIVEINHEIQYFAFKINCLRDKSKVKFKPIVDLLPLTTVPNTLRMKMEEVVIRDDHDNDDDNDDDDDDGNTDTDLDFSELLDI